MLSKYRCRLVSMFNVIFVSFLVVLSSAKRNWTAVTSTESPSLPPEMKLDSDQMTSIEPSSTTENTSASVSLTSVATTTTSDRRPVTAELITATIPAIGRYAIDASKPVYQTVIEATEFLCGGSYLCGGFPDIDKSEDCFACQFPCSCEDGCERYGDCCVDKVFNSSSENIGTIFDCVTVGHDSAYMVNKCHPNFKQNPKLVKLCQQPDTEEVLQALPVSVRSTQITFRNQFCATCNGIAEKQYDTWQYEIACEKETPQGHLDEMDLWNFSHNPDNGCSRSFRPPEQIVLRYCPVHLVTRCNADNNEKVASILCGQIISPISHNGVLYKNLFCAVCNGVLLDKEELCFPYEEEEVTAMSPLSALMDFDPLFEEDSSFAQTTETSLCEPKEIFDPFGGECLQPLCAERRVYIRGECEPVYSTAKGLGFSVFVVLTPEHSIVNWDSFTTEYISMLRKVLTPLNGYLLSAVTFHILVSVDEMTGDEKFNGAAITADILTLSDTPLDTVEEILQNIQIMAWSFKHGDGDSVTITAAPHRCSRKSNDIQFNSVREEVIRDSTSSISDECDHTCLAQIEFIPFQQTLSCPYLEVSLVETNLRYIPEMSALVSEDGSYYLNRSDFSLCLDTVKICISALREVPEIPTPTPTKNRTAVQFTPSEKMTSLKVTSIVCVTISLSLLVLTFLAHCVFPKLRDLSGKNSMCTIFNLSWAQLFFACGIGEMENVALCRTMGVLLHYFWMASFVWLAVDAHHIYALCSKVLADSAKRLDNRSTLIRNTLISNGLPLVVILLCITYHLANSRGWDIGYGDTVCFLNKLGDVGLYFIAPVGIAVGCNIYFFILSVGNLRKMPDSQEFSNRPKKAAAMVYFKWSIILGISWVFGCFAATIQYSVLWYIFVILVGVQGVFVFVYLCPNDVIWKMAKEKFEKKVLNVVDKPVTEASRV